MDQAPRRPSRTEMTSGALQSNITAEVYRGRTSRSLANASNVQSAAALANPSQKKTAAAAAAKAAAAAPSPLPVKKASASHSQDQNVHAKLPSSFRLSPAMHQALGSSVTSGPGHSTPPATTAAEAVAAAAAAKRATMASRSPPRSGQRGAMEEGRRAAAGAAAGGPASASGGAGGASALTAGGAAPSSLVGSKMDGSHFSSSSYLHRDQSSDRRLGSSPTVSSKPTLLDHRKPRRSLDGTTSAAPFVSAHKSPVFSILKDCGLPMYIIPLQKGGINDVEKLISLTSKDLSDFGLPPAHVAVLMAKFDGLKAAAAAPAATAAQPGTTDRCQEKDNAVARNDQREPGKIGSHSINNSSCNSKRNACASGEVGADEGPNSAGAGIGTASGLGLGLGPQLNLAALGATKAQQQQQQPPHPHPHRQPQLVDVDEDSSNNDNDNNSNNPNNHSNNNNNSNNEGGNDDDDVDVHVDVDVDVDLDALDRPLQGSAPGLQLQAPMSRTTDDAGACGAGEQDEDEDEDEDEEEEKPKHLSSVGSSGRDQDKNGEKHNDDDHRSSSKSSSAKRNDTKGQTSKSDKKVHSLQTTLAGVDLEIAERAIAASGHSDLLQKLLLRSKAGSCQVDRGSSKTNGQAVAAVSAAPSAPAPDSLPVTFPQYSTSAGSTSPSAALGPAFGYMMTPCLFEDCDSSPLHLDCDPLLPPASHHHQIVLPPQTVAPPQVSPRLAPAIVPPSAHSSSEQMPDVSLPFGLDDNGADADIEPEPVDPKHLRGRRREMSKPSLRGGVGKAVQPQPLGLEEALQSVDLHMHYAKLAARGVHSVDALKKMSEAEMAEVGLPRGHALKLRKKTSLIQDALPDQAAGAHEDRDRERGHHRTGSGGGKGHGRWSSSGSRSRTFSLPEPLQDVVAAAAMSSNKTPVEKSWGQVQELGVAEAADKLYKNLFELAPETVTMFPPAVLQKHRDWSPGEVVDEDLWDSPTLRRLFGKVVSAIGCTVAGLHDVDAIVPVLLRLGARHASYGVMEAHWPVLGRAFDMTLEELLGEAYTDEVRDAWMMVYNFMSSMMIEGASRCQQVAKGSFDMSCPDDVSQDSQTTATGSHLQNCLGEEDTRAEQYSSKRKQQASTSSTLPDVEDRCK